MYSTYNKLKQNKKEQPADFDEAKLKVLLVEDNLVNLKLMEKILAKFECVVTTARDGKEASPRGLSRQRPSSPTLGV